MTKATVYVRYCKSCGVKLSGLCVDCQGTSRGGEVRREAEELGAECPGCHKPLRQYCFGCDGPRYGDDAAPDQSMRGAVPAALGNELVPKAWQKKR